MKSEKKVGELIFGIGIICVCLSVSGKISFSIHLLNNFTSIGVISDFDILRNLVLMSCNPGVALVFRLNYPLKE